MQFFADIHTHSTLKASNFYFADKNDEHGSIWFQDKPKKRERDNSLVRYTQSDFTTLAKGRIKIAIVSLYPIEQNWFANHSTNLIIDLMANYATEFPIKRINHIQSDSYNYFYELQKEYLYLLRQIKSTNSFEIDGNKRNFKVLMPKNSDEINKEIDSDDCLIIIPSIEGANSLIWGNSKNISNFDIENTLNNIRKIKKWSVPPFFITLSHHFYNGISGHSKSIFGKTKFQQLIEKILLDQTLGIQANISAKGWKIIKSLLAVDEFSGNGKRILIDTKHLNTASRIEYYDFIEKYNNEHPDDKIPIINSHCAYNNKKSLQNFIEKDNCSDKVFTESEVFNEAEINIGNEDVKKIFLSGGLIGINLDERILSSKKVIDSAENLFNHQNSMGLKQYWAKQIVRNILSMAEVIMNDASIKDKDTVWDIFSIGSDFDGFINPVDAFITAEDFKHLAEYLPDAFEKNNKFNSLSNGISGQILTEKIMFQNAVEFLKKNY